MAITRMQYVRTLWKRPNRFKTGPTSDDREKSSTQPCLNCRTSTESDLWEPDKRISKEDYAKMNIGLFTGSVV